MTGSLRSLLILGLACFLVVGLAACGGSPDPETDTTMVEPEPEPAPEPEPEPEPEPAPEPEPELVLEDVFFEFDKAELRADARQILQDNARYMRANPGESLVVEGHADERGTNEYNLALGQRRADAVRDYLVDLGISASRLSTVSYGEERPFALGSTETAWSQNRRAHFKAN